MRDDQLDALIDDTARSLTDVAPPVSMRAAIRARIAAPRQGVPHVITGVVIPGVGRPGTGRLAWAGVAAAAAVLLIVALGREEAQAPGPGPPPPLVASAPPPPPSGPVPPPRAVEPRRVRAPIVAEPRAPLPPVVPVAIDRVEVTPLVVEFVEAPMPLRAERIEIEPLFTQMRNQ